MLLVQNHKISVWEIKCSLNKPYRFSRIQNYSASEDSRLSNLFIQIQFHTTENSVRVRYKTHFVNAVSNLVLLCDSTKPINTASVQNTAFFKLKHSVRIFATWLLNVNTGGTEFESRSEAATYIFSQFS
jgi:hypothetical protein